MRRIALVAALLGLAVPAQAADYMLTRALGDVLASEAYCGLTYNQAAIQAFIDKNVAADDLDFAPTLKGTTRLAQGEQEEMSGSSKTAHCEQIARAAKSYGFTG